MRDNNKTKEQLIKKREARRLSVAEVEKLESERQRAEVVLKESEEKYRALFELANDALLTVLPPGGEIIDANSAAVQMLGYSKEELQKLSGQEIIAPEVAEETNREWTTQVDSKGSFLLETIWVHRDGSRVPVQISGGPIELRGKVLFLLIARDITERQQAEAALRSEKERAEWYLDIAGVMLAALDAEGRITLINEKGCQILGYEEGELLGKKWFDTVIPQRVRYQRKGDFRKLMAGDIETVGYQEYPLLVRDGKEKLIAFHNRLIRDANGQITGILLSGEDITELRKTQEQLQHSQLLASLGEMTAGIAHEVNNPLGSILLYSELMMTSDISSQVRKDLKVIRDEAKRAAGIMTELLTYSRRVKPQMRRLNLQRMLNRVLDMRWYEQGVQNITVSTNLPDSPLYVKGDSSQLMQVFVNLLLNAEEAIRESNASSYGNIIITMQREGEWAKVSMADDGAGIPEANLSQVFYPFFTTKSAAKGTGLGLSACYGIITGHSGLIYAENNDMGGATFTVKLPLAKAPNRAESVIT